MLRHKKTDKWLHLHLSLQEFLLIIIINHTRTHYNFVMLLFIVYLQSTDS